MVLHSGHNVSFEGTYSWAGPAACLNETLHNTSVDLQQATAGRHVCMLRYQRCMTAEPGPSETKQHDILHVGADRV
jgi:hypothetical protein